MLSSVLFQDLLAALHQLRPIIGPNGSALHRAREPPTVSTSMTGAAVTPPPPEELNRVSVPYIPPSHTPSDRGDDTRRPNYFFRVARECPS